MSKKTKKKISPIGRIIIIAVVLIAILITIFLLLNHSKKDDKMDKPNSSANTSGGLVTTPEPSPTPTPVLTDNGDGTVTYTSPHTGEELTFEEKDTDELLKPGHDSGETSKTGFEMNEAYEDITETAQKVAYMNEANYNIVAEMAIYKSNFLQSASSSLCNNCYGIEAKDGEPGRTVEYDMLDENGCDITFSVTYKMYDSYEDSMADFCAYCSGLGITSNTSDEDAVDMLIQDGFLEESDREQVLSDIRVYMR